MMRHAPYLLYISSFLVSGSLGASEPSSQPAAHFSQPSIDATKKAQPSVVSIKSAIKKQSSREWDRSEGKEFSPEEFWERFFGLGPERQQKQPKPKFAYGSGFIVSADGYILTNNHVIEDAESVIVQLTCGKEYQAKVVGADPSTDIALLKIEATNLTPLSLGDSSKVEICESVIAIGNPLGLPSVTKGVISAKDRSDLNILRVEKFLQTDAAINLGNSGGPLVNLNGEAVGMNTAILTPSSGGYLGIGFAIPSNLFKEVMDELIKHGHITRGYLGVALQKVDADIASAVGLDKPQGALVSEVDPESPAENAGLQSGDIILEVQGVPLDGRGSFRNTVALAKPGDELSFKVRRDGKEMTITAKVGQYAEHSSQGMQIEDYFGILVEPLTPELAKRYSIDAKSGLLIVEIDPEGIAFMAGLRAGYAILAVNGRAVSSLTDFVSAVESAKSSGKILLQVKIGQNIRFFSLPVK